MNDAIRSVSTQIRELKAELVKLRSEATPEPVEDYTFMTAEGPVKLSQLFGDHEDLIVIHNMGRSCMYCTMWADGYSGYLRHINQRAAFVLVSPDAPEVQEAVAAERGWRFTMVQDADQRFTDDMGFVVDGGYWPGMSAFHRNADGTLVRTGTEVFGEHDDYNPVWPLFSHLMGGAGDFSPK